LEAYSDDWESDDESACHQKVMAVVGEAEDLTLTLIGR
jgi:hypothetical protein